MFAGKFFQSKTPSNMAAAAYLPCSWKLMEAATVWMYFSRETKAPFPQISTVQLNSVVFFFCLVEMCLTYRRQTNKQGALTIS